MERKVRNALFIEVPFFLFTKAMYEEELQTFESMDKEINYERVADGNIWN